MSLRRGRPKGGAGTRTTRAAERENGLAAAGRTPRRPGGKSRGAAPGDRPPEETTQAGGDQPRRPARKENRLTSRKEHRKRAPGAANSPQKTARGTTEEALRPEEVPALRNPPRRKKLDSGAPAGDTSRAPGDSPLRPLVSAPSQADQAQPVTEAAQPAAKASMTEEDIKPPPADDFALDDEPDDAFIDDLGLLGIGSRVFPPDMDPPAPEGEPVDSDAAPAYADDPTVEARIRELEARLDGLLSGVPSTDLEEPSAPAHLPVRPAGADEAIDAARELLESDYYRRKWGRGSLRERENEIDDFGLDPQFEEKLKPALDFLFKRYFRVQVEGLENIPESGRAMVVANHSGALPLDGLMLRQAIQTTRRDKRDVRWLAEDFSFYLPFIGVAMNRVGAVRACQENGERLLRKGHVVGVFPEGAEGIKKLYKNRYQLQRFGRGGFVRLALRTTSPIIPCAIIGGEETNPILYRIDNLSKLVGLEYLPLTPTFPWLGPFGLVPAPTRWRILFGTPIDVSDYGPEASRDHLLVGRISERVRSSIENLLSSGLRRRKSIWL